MSYPPQSAPPQQYPPQDQVPTPMQQAPAPMKKGRNTVGIVALVMAVIGFIFACLPGALIVGWILLPISFIVGLVGLFRRGEAVWPAVTAVIVSVVGTIIGVFVFLMVVGNVLHERCLCVTGSRWGNVELRRIGCCGLRAGKEPGEPLPAPYRDFQQGLESGDQLGHLQR